MGRPSILIFRRPPAAPSCNLTISNHGHPPLPIVPEGNRAGSGAEFLNLKARSLFLFLTYLVGVFYMTPSSSSPSGGEGGMFSRCGAMMDGHSMALTGGRPYFSLVARQRLASE